YPPHLLAAIGALADSLGIQDTKAAVYAMNDDGLWQPWDGGLEAAAWQHGSDAWAYSLAMDPGNSNHLYMGRTYPIMESKDGGRSWSFVLGSEDGFGLGMNSILVSPLR